MTYVTTKTLYKLIIFSIILNRLFFISVQSNTTKIYSSINENLYCMLNCGSEKNTLCEHAPCKMTEENCKPPFRPMLFKNNDRNLVVDLHNKLRDGINQGSTMHKFNFTTYAALDINIVSYDLELELSAQCWANLCLKQGKHDKCRRLGLYHNVGQNSFELKNASPNLSVYELTEKVLGLWKHQGIDLHPRLILPYNISNTKYDQFVQAIWNNVKGVGCGAASYSEKYWTIYVVVCNYNEAPQIGENAFKRGSHENICSQDICFCLNDTHRNLCGKYRDFTEQKWKPPFKVDGMSTTVKTTMESSTTKFVNKATESTWTWGPIQLFTNEQLSFGSATFKVRVKYERFPPCTISLGVVLYGLIL